MKLTPKFVILIRLINNKLMLQLMSFYFFKPTVVPATVEKSRRKSICTYIIIRVYPQGRWVLWQPLLLLLYQLKLKSFLKSGYLTLFFPPFLQKEIDTSCLASLEDWLVGCFGLISLFRQNISLHWAISKREMEKEEEND